MSLHETINALLHNPDTPDSVLRDAVLEFGDGTVAKVYVVCGSTGEYSDRSLWDVAAFLDEAAANSLCEQLNVWCREKGVHADQERAEAEYRYSLKCPLDSQFECDYTGTSYGVRDIPLRME